ncbi:MAG TPA: phage holin family protein [Candidatus Binataceae bacterium]|nr:phage holin family protein [Candidatus Binataceae bacterium]
MADRAQPTTNSASEADPDWATLIGRAVDDVSRIVQSELHTLRADMGDYLEARVNRAIGSLALAALMASGAICILCAAVLLLHQWLPWWQAFGCTGLAAVAAGIVGNAAIRPSTRVNT